MSALDWSAVKPRPTRKQLRLYRKWRAYLRDSKLNMSEQHERAASFAEQNREVPQP